MPGLRLFQQNYTLNSLTQTTPRRPFRQAEAKTRVIRQREQRTPVLVLKTEFNGLTEYMGRRLPQK